jgi:hypothetical protein
MKTEEDEAFDEIARKQGGGFQAKRAAAADKLQEHYDQTALELCEVCGWKTLIPDDGCLNCERAQPAQEPVAWMVYTQDGQSVYVTDNPTDIQKGQRALPLYTTPPQREWVGLTEEDFSAINQSCLTKLQAATSAESILKERNK